jgi:integrase
MEKEKVKRTTYKEPKFYLDTKKEDKTDKPAPIFLKYTFAPGQRISYFTGLRIVPDNWHLENQRVKRNVTGGTEINDILDSLKAEAEKAVRESRLMKKTLTKEILKTILDTSTTKLKKSEISFFDIFNQFVNSESKLRAWSISTLKKLNTIKTQLEAFEAHKRKHNRSYRIDINQLNERFFEELIEFWQTTYNLQNTTIQKYVRLLRWFLNWSAKKGYSTYSFKDIEIDLKQAKKKVIYLDMAEIGNINRLEIPESKEYLKRIRDIFVFHCLTGLRFSDIFNLKASDIKENVIFVTTIKTGEVIEIELNDTTRQIIEKYREHQAATGKAFPVPHNQVYNKFLKELAKLAGLKEPVTLVHYKGANRIEETFEKWQLICTHTARRSFITNGLTLGIGSEVIRSWTGHQSEKSFKDYYEIVRQRKRVDIEKFNL